MSPKLYYWRYTFGYNGFCLPFFGVVLNAKQAGNTLLIEHEMVHWHQFKRYGLLGFMARYLYHACTVGYDRNPLEVEARFREPDYVKYRYTDAVRKGESLTVSNPDFRK